MKNTKKLVGFFLVLCCAVAIAIAPAYALEVQPRTEGTDSAVARLSINNSSEATCRVEVKSRVISYQIEVVMTLNRFDNERLVPLMSWSESDTYDLSMTGTLPVEKGYKYQVEALITIKDSKGKLIESFTTTSNIVHY